MYIQPSQEELNEAHKALALLKRKTQNNPNKNITPRALTNNNSPKLNQNFNIDNQYLNNNINSNLYRGYNNNNNIYRSDLYNNNNNYSEFNTENIRTKPMQIRNPISTNNQYANKKNFAMNNNQYNNYDHLNMNYNNSNNYKNNYNTNNNNYNNNNYTNNNNYHNNNNYNYNRNNNYSNTHSNNNYSNNQYSQMNYANPKSFNPISNNNAYNNKYSNNNNNNNQNFQYNLKGEYEDNRPIHDGGAIQGDNPEKGEQTFPCPHCGRSFVQRILNKHEKICQKVFQNKRKTFNTQKQRMNDIEQISLMKQGKLEEKRNPMLNNKYKSNVPKWKLQSEEFRKIARGDFGGNNKGKGGKGNNIGYTPSVITDSYIPCKFCNRKYNEEAYNKHLAGCERRFKDAQLKNKFSKKGTSNNNLNRIGGYNNKKPIVYGAYGRK